MWTPTRSRLWRTAIVASVLPLCLAAKQIPASLDVLDLAELADGVLHVLLGLPIAIFDALTGGAFAPRSDGFLAFPSLTELAVAATCNAILFYVIGCLWDRLAVAAEHRRLATRAR